jgi:hypothetical protein
MQAMSSRSAFWTLWSCVFAIKLVIAVRLPLFGDEAWYWLEGQHLAAAYSDLPGLTAWMIRLGIEVAGHSTFGVRWPFLLLSMGVPLLLAAGAARCFGAPGGWCTGVLALLLPLLGGLGFLALPDVPLTFAAALCLVAALRLRVGVDARGAWWLGLGLVLGALSHYRFAPLVGAGLLGLMLDGGGRRALRDARVWLAIGAGALAWLPLLLWNLDHDGAGLGFQFAERHPWRFHADAVALPLSQWAVVSPLLLLVLLLGWVEAAKRWRAGAEGPWGLLLGSASVPLLGYLVLGFFADSERVTFHWLLQAYLPLLVVAPAIFTRWPRAWRRATLAVAGLGLLSVFAYAAVAATPALRERFADNRWYPDNFAGWREIAALLREHPGRHGEMLLADNFMLAAQLAFELQQPMPPTLDHPLNHKHGRAVQLALWQARATSDTGTARARLLVMEDGALPLRLRLAHYHRRCVELGGLGSPRVLDVDHGRKRFLLFELAAQASSMTPSCVLPALAWIDAPVPQATVGARFEVSGWAFKDGASLDRVEILLDGSPVATAQYGLAYAHVAEFWEVSTDIAHPRVGFRAEVDASRVAPGDHWLGLRLHGRDGSVETWPEQRLHIVR